MTIIPQHVSLNGRVSKLFTATARRRAAYALFSLPIGLAALPMAAAGRAAAGRHRGFVLRMLGLRAGRTTHLPRRVLVHGLLSTPVNLLASVITGYGWSIVVLNIAYPIRPLIGLPGYDPNAWGGPTYAGAWAFHALAGGVPAIFVTALAARGFAALQQRIARRLLVGPTPKGDATTLIAGSHQGPRP
ncbi:hypothetical protein [Kitasatospora sp. McL0602]|uniref:hypothetical protein n=1 Tax=Kitasatospora sp. McL0602 TaxID=3439530 RepID=UPI003F8C3FB1